jgi:hypothetical protein
MMQYTGGAKPKGTEKQATQLLVQIIFLLSPTTYQKGCGKEI